MNDMEVKLFDEADVERYEQELKKLGWCLACQGEGQIPREEDPTCRACDGTGKA